ncbi:MAG TPA: hypothetical protein VKA97_08265 [Pyrinomonadaceae bacterium]|nr:hypothetical protein [Pyrinomonadaceae bacterium]
MKRMGIYLLMVGTPLLGVLVVLHFGQRIPPTPSVAGAWTMQADFASLSSSPCAELVRRIEQPALLITQSGMYLQLRLNNREQTTIDGQLRGTTLSAGVAPSEFGVAEWPCGKNAVNLTAELNKETRELNGQLRIAGCATCAPATFEASRPTIALSLNHKDTKPQIKIPISVIVSSWLK